MDTTMSDVRELFGGCLSAILPPGVKDVSELREIPDNQEVFVHPMTDQSLIIEILEYVEEPDEQAIRTHFDDVADSNGASSNEDNTLQHTEQVDKSQTRMSETHFDDVADSNGASSNEDNTLQHTEQVDKSQTRMSECDKIYYILGQQRVSEFKESSKNLINVHMGLFRLPTYTTDILVTFNDPVSIDPDSSSHAAIPVSASRWMEEEFQSVVKSLSIDDPAIFT
ncbi:ran guanine nucleotide release factor-like [Haliotis rubra]|uniref:ran guanine nucleotide release factor-like n=1 Tax=Haliotis rubra TaxID=36100 RepID=UPI001EE62435|nr:ran guanine nucleotide release factor-like [Haliotis rubra]